MSWDDVTQTDTFQQANPLEQRDLAGHYFDQKIAGQFNIPSDKLDEYKQQFVTQKIPEPTYVAAKGAEAAVSTLGKNVSGLLGVSNPTDDAQTEQLNTEQAERTSNLNQNSPSFLGVGQGDFWNFAGKSIPALAVGVPGAALGEAAGAATVLQTKAVESAVASKVLPWLGGIEGGTQGATLTAEGDVGENAKTASWLAPFIDLGIKTPGALIQGAKNVMSKFTQSGKEFLIGGRLNENLPEEAKTNLANYTTTPQDKQPYNLTTAAVTQTPYAANLEKDVSGKQWYENNEQVVPANQLQAQKEETLSKLGGELGETESPKANIAGLGKSYQQDIQAQKQATEEALAKAQGTSEEATKTVQAQGTLFKQQTPSQYEANVSTGQAAQDLSQGKRAEYAATYNAIDPNKVVKTPIINTAPAVRDNFSDLPKAAQKVVAPYNNPAAGMRSTAGQLVEDNAELGKLKAAFDYGTPEYDSINNIQNALKKDLENNNAPSAIPGATVAQQAAKAKQQFTDFQRLTENPETAKANGTGASFNPFGEYDAAAQRENVGGLGETGKKVIPVQSPSDYNASLYAVKAMPNGGNLVKNQILGAINNEIDSTGGNATEAFDKIYNKDIQNITVKQGFTKENSELVALGNSLKENSNNAAAQSEALTAAKTKFTQEQTAIETSAGRKLLNETYGAKLPSEQIDAFLKSGITAQKEMINKAAVINDGGASLRGIGQNIINKLYEDSVERTGNIANPTEQLNWQKYNQALLEHKDILAQTLDKPTLDALLQINKVGEQLEYSKNYGKGGGALTEGSEALQHGLATEVGSKALSLGPPAAIGKTLLGIKNYSQEAYYKVLNQVVQNPYYAKALMDAADKNPYTIKSLVDNILSTSSAKSAAIGSGITGRINNKQDLNRESSPQIQQKGSSNAAPQSSIPSVGATNNALNAASSSKKNFSLSDLNPISEAEASTIKTPENPQAANKVQTFMSTPSGKSLQKAITKQGATASEIMTMVNAESGVKHTGGNDYGQMTDIAWEQAKKILNKPELDRHNPDDYANAVVATYKWTADQVRKLTGSAGTPSVAQVYPAYNAGIGGFKALLKASPTDLAKDVVPENVSANNKSFYYGANGTPLTVAQTFKAYKNYINNKQAEMLPANSSGATKMALSSAEKTPKYRHSPVDSGPDQ